MRRSKSAWAASPGSWNVANLPDEFRSGAGVSEHLRPGSAVDDE